MAASNIGRGGPRLPLPILDTGGTFSAAGPQQIPIGQPTGGMGGQDDELRNLAMLQLGLALMDDRPVGEPFYSTNVAPILSRYGDQLLQRRQLDVEEQQGERQLDQGERRIGVEEQAEQRRAEQGERELDLKEQEVQMRHRLLTEENALKKENNEINREKMQAIIKQNEAELLLKGKELRQELALAEDENRIRAQANIINYMKVKGDLDNQGRMADAEALYRASKAMTDLCGDVDDPLGLGGGGTGGCTPEQRVAVYEEELRRIRPDLYEAGMEGTGTGGLNMQKDLDIAVEQVQQGNYTMQEGLDAIRQRYGANGVEQFRQRMAKKSGAGDEEAATANGAETGTTLTPPSQELPNPETRSQADAMKENALGWLRTGIDITDWFKRNRQLMTPEVRKEIAEALREAKGQ